LGQIVYCFWGNALTASYRFGSHEQDLCITIDTDILLWLCSYLRTGGKPIVWSWGKDFKNGFTIILYLEKSIDYPCAFPFECAMVI